MAVFLALDLGTKRIGVAISRGGTLAEPLCSIIKLKGAVEAEIVKLCAEHAIETIIVGMPYNEHGAKTSQCEVVERFCRRLERRGAPPIVFMDEFGSSIEAKQRLRSKKLPPKKLRETGLIDAESASIILQNYIDELESSA